MKWNELAKARLKEIGKTQDWLAERIGMTQGGLGHWLSGRRDPSIDKIALILKELQLDGLMLHSDGTLEYPDHVIANITPIDIQPTYQNKFPVLSAVQAGQWTEACEPYTLDEIDEWHETTVRTSERCFWLRVQGDSMTSPVGTSIPEGMLVLVDTRTNTRTVHWLWLNSPTSMKRLSRSMFVMLGKNI